MSETTNNSPNWKGQGIHPTYQKLADLKQSKEGIESLLDKARKKAKPSWAQNNKQHNTSTSQKGVTPIDSENQFNKRKQSADGAARTRQNSKKGNLSDK